MDEQENNNNNKRNPSHDPGSEHEIVLVVARPSYELRVCAPGGESAMLFAMTRFRLIQAGDIGYATLAHMVNMREFVSENGDTPTKIAVMRVNSVGEFELGFTMPLFYRLSKTAQTELMKLQLLRIPYGHFSDRAGCLIDRYGPEIANRAAEMVLSQLVNPAVLADEGIILPVPEMWDLERNQTWETYCKALSDTGNGHMPSPMSMVSFDGQKIVKIKPSNGGLMLDKHGLSNISDLNDVCHSDPVTLSNASKELLNRVDEELKRQQSSLKAQGFMAGDALEFIEALERPAKVDWTQRLRGTFGRFESRRRKINKHRPSRRGWPMDAPDGRMVDYYKGCIRKKDTFVLFAIDTSGSMSARELRCVEAELRGIAQRALVMVIHADADVIGEPEVFHPWTRLREFRGRGGTSFEPVFRYAKSMTPKPDLVVYYTDGYDFTFEARSDISTLWLLTSTGCEEAVFRERINHGEVIKVDVDETS